MNALNITQAQRQAADAHRTSDAIWLACEKVAESTGADVEQVWSDPTLFQGNDVIGQVQEWIRAGLIEEGDYQWGASTVTIMLPESF